MGPGAGGVVMARILAVIATGGSQAAARPCQMVGTLAHAKWLAMPLYAVGGLVGERAGADSY